MIKQMTSRDLRPHPIISEPHTLDVLALSFWSAPNGATFLDLHLVGPGRSHWLRFSRPTKLSIETGFPRRGGLFFVDHRDSQMENITIEAIDLDGSQGALRFCAESVVELAHNVWVFHGSGAAFASVVFRDENEARSWVSQNHATGTLTGYVLDQSAYEWAVQHGYFTPKRPDQREIRFIEKFTSASQTHWHFTDGHE